MRLYGGRVTQASSNDQPLKVLFVCTANICRSAYAAVRAQQLLAADAPVTVGSAGTHGWVDHPMDAPMAAQARARGADPDAFRSRRLTGALVADADLLLTAESRHRDFVLDEWPAAVRRTFTLQQFAEIADAAPPLDARALLAEAHRTRRPARASGDVPDPYGRGPEAAATTAAQLDALLAVILPRLAAHLRGP